MHGINDPGVASFFVRTVSRGESLRSEEGGETNRMIINFF
jgi:hypothetical protein